MPPGAGAISGPRVAYIEERRQSPTHIYELRKNIFFNLFRWRHDDLLSPAVNKQTKLAQILVVTHTCSINWRLAQKISIETDLSIIILTLILFRLSISPLHDPKRIKYFDVNTIFYVPICPSKRISLIAFFANNCWSGSSLRVQLPMSLLD